MVDDREELDRLGEKVRLLEAKVVVLEAEKEERTSVKEKVERLERIIESQEEIDVIIEFNVDENEIPYAEGNYQLLQKCI